MHTPKTSHNRKTKTDDSDLSEEIRILRGIIRQVARLTDEGEDTSGLQQMLRIVAEASTRLATLLRTQQALAGDANRFNALEQALEQIAIEIQIAEAQKTAEIVIALGEPAGEERPTP
jgi:hypothetical protein